MSTTSRRVSIREIAGALVMLRKQGKPPLLFLGSRTGGLFDNTDFYDIIKEFSLLNFETLSEGEKFQECYHVLKSKRANARDRFEGDAIREILMRSLGSLYYREEYELLARMARMGLFHGILTTNLDNLIEESFWDDDEADMYQVFIPGASSDKKTPPVVSGKETIVKIFGDIQLPGYHTVGRKFDLEADQPFKTYLIDQLSRDILLVGYDSVWDEPIEKAFPLHGGKVWYIDEDTLASDKPLARVVEQRQGYYLQGPLGSYKYFWQACYDCIKDEAQKEAYRLQWPVPQRGEAKEARFPVAPREQSASKEKPKASVFISYAPADSAYLDRLKVHLQALSQDRPGLTIWSEPASPPGALHQRESEQALESATVAVLLVSADFLASPRIRERELPALLQAASEKKMTLLPVILSPCAWNASRFPHQQVVNSPSEPLMGMTPYEQEVVWTKLAQQVQTLLDP